MSISNQLTSCILIYGASFLSTFGAIPKGIDDLSRQQADGYRGIWYYNGKLESEHRYKYSGGFATYPQWHMPFAIYVPAVRKTFFVFGGSAGNISETGDELEHMISYYDHVTGEVPRPMRVLRKRTKDAHDNPVLSIDDKGILYIFSSAHGLGPTSYIHRSLKPYDISTWETVSSWNFSYPQPWYLPQSRQFLFLHTIYSTDLNLGIRGMAFRTSSDGKVWSEPQRLAGIQRGDYQLSARFRDTDRVAVAFDMHPKEGRAGTGLNYRTNIYYVETSDAGRTWKTVDGKTIAIPIKQTRNPALVRDYLAEDRNVYLKNVTFTDDGRPVILYLTSKSWQPGESSGPFQWTTAEWTGQVWRCRLGMTSDHNYDHGELSIDSDGTWRVIAPTEPGPQPWGTGGEMVLWTSRDAGEKWVKEKVLTHGSQKNHTYARRPVNAQPDFYALWADGSPLTPTPSSLYFATREGRVYRLPERMTGATAKPELVQ